jgi:hypothetical protein
MKNVRTTFAAIMSAPVFSMAPTAFAQQSGVINVDTHNVANNIAEHIHVDASRIPVTVQAPIGVAASVCNVAANVLDAQGGSGGGRSCTAQTTSTALDQAVQRHIKSTGQR